MSELSINHFQEFFRELHEFDGMPIDPYPWQIRLAERAIQGDWPGAIDLPTGSGKTACIDIAIFAMACQAERPVAERSAPRRIVFCVNRRVIVDQAYDRACKIAKSLWEAEKSNDTKKPTLAAVAKCLRKFAGNSEPVSDTPPLDALELRGGIYRDNRWARSAVQPTIICSTIDQIGSRLLFRGYGVSSGAAPIQAALLAYDSLILLDEAHISQPFRQSVYWVQQYLDINRWARDSIGVRPMVFVPMTATPTTEMRRRGVISLQDDDRSEKYPLAARLNAQKVAALEAVDNVTTAAIKSAKVVLNGESAALGIIVNRVATARAIFAELQRVTEKRPDLAVELVIGSMRPVDRDRQQKRLRESVGPERPPKTEKCSVTISTQCLEVGADYDFDYLITECASLDALRQRFGRLNRGGREIIAKAEVLIDKKQIQSEDKLDDSSPLDPIYGNAHSRTWNWLVDVSVDDRIDFGVEPFHTILNEHGNQGQIPEALLSPSASLNAPVMMPAYVDLWSQTSPKPAVDPDVSLFIHGDQQALSDVRVCWRRDLTKGKEGKNPFTVSDWVDIVSLLPPTSAECMSVSISRFRKWILRTDEATEPEADLLAITQVESSQKRRAQGDQQSAWRSDFVIWRGNRYSFTVADQEALKRLCPGDTVVLPEAARGWDELGHVVFESSDAQLDPRGESDERGEILTSSTLVDVAEHAWREAKDREVMRLCPNMRDLFPADESINALFDGACGSGERLQIAKWKELLLQASETIKESHSAISERFANLSNSNFGLEVQYYPKRKGVVLTTRRRLGTHVWFLPSLDDGDDDASYGASKQLLTLSEHTFDVVELTKRTVELLLPGNLLDAFLIAADLHDLGKADPRFQAMLRRANSTDAWLHWQNDDSLLAKSPGNALSRQAFEDARQRAGLPDQFRHELLSLLLAEQLSTLSDDELMRELVLHVIASHHGYCRPLAPVVKDPSPPDVEVRGLSIQAAQRYPCHQFDSGIPERFWELTRQYGWWGLAYLEAMLRLSDQQASALADTRSAKAYGSMKKVQGVK